jgi:hypothetical protein
MKYLILIASLLVSACGSASGGGAGSGAPASNAPGSDQHVYTMQVTGQDTDFNFSPVLTGTNGNSVSPGVETVNLGQTKTYTITDSQADIQITGISDVENNNAYYVSVVLLKDGVEILSWNIGVGISEDSGTI